MEKIEFYLTIPKDSMRDVLNCITESNDCRLIKQHSEFAEYHIVVDGTWECYQKMLDLQSSGVAFHSIEHFEDDL